MKDFFEDKVVGTWNDADYRVKGTIIGAGVGATAGYIAGFQEESHNVVVTKTYLVPMTKDRNLGSIPAYWYQDDSGRGDPGPDAHSLEYSPNGWVEVHRDAPRLDGLGQPMMNTRTETLHSMKFNSFATTFMGIGLGMAAGFLTSIAIRLLNELREAK
ncbi:MAG: hypothetical protein EHM79_00900 [Geobacter sp.]|nr:MAG: hypothetical protein EHM79_00900 [Geobacter sp.]